MEITNKRVLILGGAGLVGMAICRRMLPEHPDELIVASLFKAEAIEACEILARRAGPNTVVTPVWGNIFVRESLKDLSRQKILDDPESRRKLIDDVLGEFNDDVLQRSYLYKLVKRFRPHIVIDCVNSATAVAYQDIYKSYFQLTGYLQSAREANKIKDGFVDEVEQLLCTLYIPQLIRHVQILYEAMRQVKTGYYFKIGTSGTGGMGLNIPYTHSEEKPSRVLLSKSSIAGAHSMLLFLMARTPDAPITKEIKPTAAIAWKRIAHGTIQRAGKPIQLYDCPPDEAAELKDRITMRDEKCGRKLDNRYLKSVFIDTGENGIFSEAEFEAISSSGQMEFVTPEEIAHNVVFEIKGGNTGHDIINALDNATMGPTYRAGVMRQRALEMMRELREQHNCDSVAFELLGPPRLSKLLYEGYLLKQQVKSLDELQSIDEAVVAKALEQLVLENQKLRSEIISIGIPILLGDGKRLLRGPVIKIPPYRGYDELEVTTERINKWAFEGWVDLRVENILTWKRRAQEIFKQLSSIPEDDTSSLYDRNLRFWQEDRELNIGKLAGWILATEERGERMKY